MKKITLYLFSILLFSFVFQSGAQVPASWQTRGVGGGGALFFPRINPANDNEFYVACDMSEMFHSTDFGNSYTQLHFTKLPAMNVSTYEFTNNANIAYSNYNDGNAGYPVKTIDGGNTWPQLPGFNSSLGGIYAMKANYNNPNQVLLNYYADIYFSNDGGANFSLVRHAANNGVGIIMGGVFIDGLNIYIGTNEGLVYSSNGGTSFSLMATSGIPAGQVLWNFSGAKAGNTTRFVCITGATADVYNGLMPYDYYNFPTGVYTMDNANGTWVSNSTGINFSNDFVMYAGMAENDINTIYLGGSDAALNAPLVYKSTNGGTSWSKVFLSTNNQNIHTGWSGYQGDKGWSWGETCFGIAVAPNNSNKVMFGDFGFVHLTADGGATWKQAYVSNADQHPMNAPTPQHLAYHSIGLENTTCWQVHWQDANNMLAAYSDIGLVRSTDAGVTWSFNYTGMSVNSTYRLAKHSNGTLFATTSAIHDMYQSTRLADSPLDNTDSQGKIMYSTDNGATWQQIHSFSHPVFWIALDPNNSNRAYASVIHYNNGSGIGGIYRCDNLLSLGSSTWTLLTDPPRTQKHPASIVVLNDGKMVCTFSGRRNSSGTFTNSSGCFIYDPSGGSWTDVSDPGMYYWTKDIVIDPYDATQNTWYVSVFSGWGGAPNGLGGLYKTTNRGTSWVKLTASQFDRVTSITFHPTDANEIYLTTETQGLWRSTNINSVTPSFALVNSYDFRQPERIFFNPYNPSQIWASSFGNGMKMGDISTAITQIQNGNLSVEIFPNPAINEFRIINSGFRIEQIEIYDAMGKKCLALKPFQESAAINISELSPGIYFVKVSTEKKSATEKLVIIK